MSELTKACSKCKVEKVVGEFCKDKRRPSGLSSLCKECERKRGEMRRKDNPEKEKERGRKYYNDNIKKESERKRKFYIENKDTVSTRVLEYRIKNYSKYLEYNIAYNKANPGRSKEASRRYRRTTAEYNHFMKQLEKESQQNPGA